MLRPTLTLRTTPAKLEGMETTLEYAEAHFAQLLRRVVQGEEILLCEGAQPVARIVPLPKSEKHGRPLVGEITSAPIRWSRESFTALDEAGMKALGLL